MVVASPPLAQQTWQWQDHTIAYTVVGEGQPLVLIHGFGASIGHWRHNIPVWAAAGYQVWAIDLLGFGASDKADVPYSVELWTSLLVDFWTQQIQRPVVWIGNSIGALLALTLAAQHPNLCRGTVLINCAGGLNHRPSELHPVLGWVMTTFTKLVATPGIGTFLFNRIRQPQRIRATLKQVYYQPAAITDELVELLYRPSCDPGAQKVFATILTADAGIPPEELLPLVKVPILVLWGARDPWTPIARGEQLQQYVAATTPYRFVALPDTGHCPHDENPQVVNPLVTAWLRELPC